MYNFQEYDYLQKLGSNYNFKQLNKQSPLTPFIQVLYDKAAEIADNKHYCCWEDFGGYEIFRDYYFDHNKKIHFEERQQTSDQQERKCRGNFDYPTCKICGNNDYEEGHWAGSGDLIDFTLPRPRLLQVDIGKNTFNLFDNPKQIEFYEILYKNDFDNNLDRYGIKNGCLCPKLIKICEKIKLFFQSLLVQLKLIKVYNPNFYSYLKTLRLEKIIELLQYYYQFQNKKDFILQEEEEDDEEEEEEEEEEELDEKQKLNYILNLYVENKKEKNSKIQQQEQQLQSKQQNIDIQQKYGISSDSDSSIEECDQQMKLSLKKKQLKSLMKFVNSQQYILQGFQNQKLPSILQDYFEFDQKGQQLLSKKKICLNKN